MELNIISIKLGSNQDKDLASVPTTSALTCPGRMYSLTVGMGVFEMTTRHTEGLRSSFPMLLQCPPVPELCNSW